MTNGAAAAPGLKHHLLRRVISGPGPINRLRARRFGADYLTGTPPTLELYYEPGDPHSHLSAQLLPLLRDRLRLPIKVYVVVQEESSVYPEVHKQRLFALDDACRIAPAWGLSMPARPEMATQEARYAAARCLLAAADLNEFVRRERALASALFGGLSVDTAGAMDSASAGKQLQANAARRARLGHYLPGMWQFNGDWFWAVDRLSFLQRALQAADALEGDKPLLTFDPTAADLPRLKEPAPLEFFYSFRSPYSYLAAVQLRQRLDTLPTALVVRPVLPMAMRGFKIPMAKRLYISRDVYREAEDLGIPFGLIADPIGEGAARCLTAFPLASGVRQQLDFLVSAATACWSEAVDLASDTGLRFAAERAGLSWEAVSAKLSQDPDLDYAEANRQQLFAAGFWGVPSFRLGSFATWGRDRLWMVEELIRRQRAAAE